MVGNHRHEIIIVRRSQLRWSLNSWAPSSPLLLTKHGSKSPAGWPTHATGHSILWFRHGWARSWPTFGLFTSLTKFPKKVAKTKCVKTKWIFHQYYRQKDAKKAKSDKSANAKKVLKSKWKSQDQQKNLLRPSLKKWSGNIGIWRSDKWVHFRKSRSFCVQPFWKTSRLVCSAKVENHRQWPKLKIIVNLMQHVKKETWWIFYEAQTMTARQTRKISHLRISKNQSNPWSKIFYRRKFKILNCLLRQLYHQGFLRHLEKFKTSWTLLLMPFRIMCISWPSFRVQKKKLKILCSIEF